jgi:hypothetical protein
MAKGQMRGNRETKKPKQDKVKVKDTPSPFTVVPSKTVGSVKPNTGKR